MIIDRTSLTCLHDRVEIRRRPLSDGRFQIANQCLDCGRTIGNWLKRSAVPNPECLPWWDTELNESRRYAAEAGVASVGPSRAEQYEQHLASEAWAELRIRVFRRDGGLCQGCLNAPATDLHHLTYHDFGDEFCWQLVSVCRACHTRIHGLGEDVAR